MKRAGVWQRLKYWFDNLMSKGTASLLLLLAVITTVVVVIGGLIAVAIGGADGTDGGSTIYMKPITRYVTANTPVNFYTLGASAARYGEIAIGYKKYADDGSFSIEVNPRSREATTFYEQDDLIVVAKN